MDFHPLKIPYLRAPQNLSREEDIGQAKSNTEADHTANRLRLRTPKYPTTHLRGAWWDSSEKMRCVVIVVGCFVFEGGGGGSGLTIFISIG